MIHLSFGNDLEFFDVSVLFGLSEFNFGAISFFFFRVEMRHKFYESSIRTPHNIFKIEREKLLIYFNIYNSPVGFLLFPGRETRIK